MFIIHIGLPVAQREVGWLGLDWTGGYSIQYIFGIEIALWSSNVRGNTADTCMLGKSERGFARLYYGQGREGRLVYTCHRACMMLSPPAE